jgi:regulator of protease activity HflC (stomatin/prohibitin superfamily)
MSTASIVIVVILVLLALVATTSSATRIHQHQRGLVERFGRFKVTLEPGLHFIVPFVDVVAARIDMRESVIDVDPQTVITNDNVTVNVDAIIYFFVVDPKAVKYEVANFRMATSKLAQTNLRNLIGDMALDETLTSRDRINVSLRETLDEATDKWGVRVTRVEVKEIEPPRDITDAMSMQMKAEREKRSTILSAEAYRDKQILEAEGDKQNAILTAEGEKTSAILRAEGAKQSAILTAEGEAEAIQKVSTAAEKYFVGNAQTLRQMEVTQASLENNSKIVVPEQSKLINILGFNPDTIAK